MVIFIDESGIQLADALASLIRYYHDNPQEKDAKKPHLKVRSVSSYELFPAWEFVAGNLL